MAVFGAPVAHGNDAERAVRAALAIQEAMPRLGAQFGRDLQAHVGIASGEVVAAGTGSLAFREYTVTGNSVNLASRLTDRAGPGEILLSEAVHRLLADRIRAAPLTESRSKGCRDRSASGGSSVLSTRPKRHATIRRPARRTHPDQGCARELPRWQLRPHDLYPRRGRHRQDTPRGRICPHGRGGGFAVHKGLVLDFGTGKGQDAIRSVVRSLLALDPATDPAARRDAAEHAVAEGMVDGEQRGHLYDLLDLPLSAELRPLHDAMDNDTRNRGKAATFCDLVRRSTGRRPCLVIVEDVHWASSIVLLTSRSWPRPRANARRCLP